MRRVVVLVVLAVLAVRAPARGEAPETATATLQRYNEHYAGWLSETPQDDDAAAKLAGEMAAATRELFDVRELVARALVDHWSELSADQQDTIVELLGGLIERSQRRLMRKYLQFRWEFRDEAAGDDGAVVVDAVIHTKRRRRSAEISVKYECRADGDLWTVVDLITDGVSMVDNYRSELNRVIKKSGVDGLIARLERKLAADDGD